MAGARDHRRQGLGRLLVRQLEGETVAVNSRRGTWEIALGVDVETNEIEHARAVADRRVRLGSIIGKERLLAGTDCGLGTSIRSSVVDPGVAWLKLRSLSQGAELASAEL